MGDLCEKFLGKFEKGYRTTEPITHKKGSSPHLRMVIVMRMIRISISTLISITITVFIQAARCMGILVHYNTSSLLC
jgi:hypothetical protein